MSRRIIRLILNGKEAGNPAVRDAVHAIRAAGHRVQVRVTWEDGDAERLTEEALGEAEHWLVDCIIAGGGDGTINQVFGRAFQVGLHKVCTLGVLPLGTANDFARSTGIPVGDPEAALRLALEESASPIDVGLLNGRPFVNLVTGGFGSQVTAETDTQLKSRIGSLAYVLTGLSRVKDLASCSGRFTAPGFEWEGAFMAFAIGNGRQAGGGISLCPEALLDDGELDLMILPAPASGIEAVGTLLQGATGSAPIGVSVRAPWIQFEASEEIAINLDGEPQQVSWFRVECAPKALRVHLGDGALLSGGAK